MMTKLFILVVSLWGYTGTEWVYVGNQMSLIEPMTLEVCEDTAEKFIKFEDNEYYRFSVECVEHSV